MSVFEAVVFDLFGTLIDFMPDDDYKQNSLEMARALGVSGNEFRMAWMETSLDRNLGLFGSLRGDIEQVCARIGSFPDSRQIDEAREIRQDIARRNHRPRADAIASLKSLKGFGAKLGLLSVTPYDSPEVWPETEFAELFDATVFSCECGLSKRDPAIYSLVCDSLGVKPSRCIYVGDGSFKELTMAQAAGMRSVLIRVDYDGDYDFYRDNLDDWRGPKIECLSDIINLYRTGL